MKPLALIIDDNDGVREVVQDCLEELGHKFHAVGSQREATEHLDRHRYDYILLDLELPRQFGAPTSPEIGRELLRQIKLSPNNSAAPVLAMSAHFDPGSKLAEGMVALGAVAAIGKPFVDLKASIRDMLNTTAAGSVELSAHGRAARTGVSLAPWPRLRDAPGP